MLKIILNFLFPQKCLGCGKENEIFCPKCLTKTDRADLPEDNGVFAAANYQDGVLKKAVWMLKYKGVSQLAEPLAELLKERVWQKVQSKLKSDDVIVIPVPLSGRRSRQRGFNQAELIARRLSSNVLTNALYKTVHTDSQVNVKDREKRLNNVKGSFAVKNAELIKGKEIILVDDICTTGATLKEAKKVLKESGAKKVLAVVVARG
ncbi:MAG: ComF family protein [Candidatus Pacebacteria bacterium]|nr:ComF family protein [Candidatus Paceibacterota bacterium]NUQ57138.1 ComF family protein [Candidatus Paceibacter sp.]